MKIGIIGSGIAGLMAARQLHEQQHAITVFEAQDYIGGHVKTVRDAAGEDGAGSMPVELGVFMHDPRYIHPTMNAYVRKLGVVSKNFCCSSSSFNNVGRCWKIWLTCTKTNYWSPGSFERFSLGIYGQSGRFSDGGNTR